MATVERVHAAGDSMCRSIIVVLIAIASSVAAFGVDRNSGGGGSA